MAFRAQTEVPAQRLAVRGSRHTTTPAPCHTLSPQAATSEAGRPRPPLPLPGVSACGHSRPSAHWAPAAAGRPCCSSELWSAERTCPNLKQAEEHRDKVSRTPAEPGSLTSCPGSLKQPSACKPAWLLRNTPEGREAGQQRAVPTHLSSVVMAALRGSRAG